LADTIHDQKPLGIARHLVSRRLGLTGQSRSSNFGLCIPEDVSQLKQFVQRCFGLTIPDRPLCPNHNSPLDYLARSFFGQEDLLVWANRGGGKTMLAAVATLLDAIFRYPTTIRVLGGSFDQSDRLAQYVRDILSGHPRLVDGQITRQGVRLVGGSEIRVLAQSQRAVRGQHVQKLRCDEVDLFDSEVWRAVQFITQSDRAVRGSIEVLSTLHRPGGLMERLIADARGASEAPAGTGYKLINWCLWEVIERCPSPDEPGGRRCEDCLLAEDCRGIARRGRGFFRIDDAIAIKARSSRAAWDTEMLCRGAHRDWLVFSEFSEAKHVGQVEYCSDWPLYRAIDFGYRNPLVCLWIQLTPSGRVHVLDEYVRAQLPLPRHAAEILKRSPGPVVMSYVDPAGRQHESTSGSACTELLAAAGIPCVSRASSIADGLELIRSALAPAVGAPTICIHPRCLRLIEAFNGYHYPPPGSSAPADKPVKDGPDHHIDALRYFFINRMRPKIAIARSRY